MPEAIESGETPGALIFWPSQSMRQDVDAGAGTAEAPSPSTGEGVD